MKSQRIPAWVAPSAGVAVAALYGVLARFVFGSGKEVDALGPAFVVLSLAFLLVVPGAIGALTILFGSEKTRASVVRWIFLPWLTCLVQIGVVVALAWEGAICIVLAAPIYLAMASIGGIAAGAILRAREEAARPPVMFATVVVLLPFLVAPLESRFAVPVDLRTVTNETVIDADAATVFRNVVSVSTIEPSELRFSPFRLIGVPRPIEATLSGEGVGAVRTARFSGDIVFRERVTAWEPERRLAFGIEVDPKTIRPDVLDEHVKVGTSSFDVLRGEFVLERISAKRTRLLLSSRHRLATRLNLYAGFWTDAVMRDLQVTICRVIKERAESVARETGARGRSTPPERNAVTVASSSAVPPSSR